MPCTSLQCHLSESCNLVDGPPAPAPHGDLDDEVSLYASLQYQLSGARSPFERTIVDSEGGGSGSSGFWSRADSGVGMYSHSLLVVSIVVCDVTEERRDPAEACGGGMSRLRGGATIGGTQLSWSRNANGSSGRGPRAEGGVRVEISRNCFWTSRFDRSSVSASRTSELWGNGVSGAEKKRRRGGAPLRCDVSSSENSWNFS